MDGRDKDLDGRKKFEFYKELLSKIIQSEVERCMDQMVVVVERAPCR